jgi:nicotinate-nucleotide pyrophosphorylase
MTLENVTAAAESGVDYISVGKITHSAGSVDLSMKGEF